MEPSSESELAIVEPHRPTASPTPRRWLPWVIGALLLLLGSFGLWRWWQARSQPPENAMQGRAAPVEVAAVQTGRVQEATEFVGNLTSRNAVELSPEIEGRVTRIFVQAGDRVAQGTPIVLLSPDRRQAELAGVLASVNSARAIRANAASQIEALQAERVASLAEVELQTTQRNRIANLVAAGALAREQLDIVERDRRTALSALAAIDQRIEAARANLAEAQAGLAQAQANASAANVELQDTIVRAPFAGVVGDIPVRVGQVVSSSDTLTSITENDRLELEIAVPIERSADLRTGQRVELSDAQGKALGVGQVSFISPQANPTAQTVLVKTQFPNPGGRLLNNQFVRARLIWDDRSGLLVPSAAISRLGGETFVFLAESQPLQPGQPPQLVARQRLVELGSIQGNNYQVLEGLQPGDRIVTSGVLNLSDGIPISPMQEGQAAPQS
ncbi:efflux RND transporter periplasmic adaptor subunit [Microcoleus sp. FACHB-1515]|uniref:efflux RND transporter periplasmic adaptor subunit n=1 Tax=Cyanophyceae TaxID=3028117 RepID=UPI001685F291|nr:efflux RND transporter periplasmic adaptor subunit [Microcoleus sp. FACHB-1515]MBD2090061.1 efflux RND transporter periplasmic adaptor subunit [Microcoleus sp. FACHB-1515]